MLLLSTNMIKVS